ncbi:family 48 glycosyltransferase [Halteromyces radiatus]|uniref:family 48 glycosyltransferase n=1 Tax=Halteromyces radiatus TaxID=101107 RepID=UPI00221FD0CE|nr:family 48 glycosyltransferase [Halteromyces radiatus]KAI8089088.1 family 48 glycosyltransferase [Halteromyces radiatus]
MINIVSTHIKLFNHFLFPSRFLFIGNQKNENDDQYSNRNRFRIQAPHSLNSSAAVATATTTSIQSTIKLYDQVKQELQDTGRYLKCAPSSESLLALIGCDETKRKSHKINSSFDDKSTTSTSIDDYEQYPSWYQAISSSSTSSDIPDMLTIHNLFSTLQTSFGFQMDSMRNMMDHLLTLLDSRASRMSATQAIVTLHADYVGGPQANYRKWYFLTQLTITDNDDDNDLEHNWQKTMENISHLDRLEDLALWLMIWSEASVLRFCPELLCFIFYLAKQFKQHSTSSSSSSELFYLTSVVTPLYIFIQDQSYYPSNKHTATRQSKERDHAQVIGYDDINQFFWSASSIATLRSTLPTSSSSSDGSQLLMDYPPHQRYTALGYVQWSNAFKKTFKEKRSWLHLAVNFTRIWILHIVSFWYYIVPNVSFLYLHSTQQRQQQQHSINDVIINNELDEKDRQHELAVIISITALGGALATILVIFGSIMEYMYVPLVNWKQVGLLIRRLVLLLIILIVNVAPSVYCCWYDRVSLIAKVIATIQLLLGIGTTVFLVLTPQAQLLVPTIRKEHPFLEFSPLRRQDRIVSIGLWSCVFGCKLLESYFFLALPFKDPLRLVAALHLECTTFLCQAMPLITSVLMILTELILFFLDTYLWYVIWNTVFSIVHSFYVGMSILTPWRNIFTRLPKRIYAKLLDPDSEAAGHPKTMCSQIWNALILSMFREHLLSADHVAKLLYQQNSKDANSTLSPPTFFVSQQDKAFDTEYYPPESEAERRLQFLASSLASPMPEAVPVPQMPTFTVMTPHYSEKILLSLREIIRQDNKDTRITLLEYLRHLYNFEWNNFVNDTKIMAETSPSSIHLTAQDQCLADEALDTSSTTSSERTATNLSFNNNDNNNNNNNKADDLPFYYLGFKSATPEYTLRTRIWASLRSQTLYRTISGFMNYHKAIKLLYRVETPELLMYHDESRLEKVLDRMANRKFRFLIAMQRYSIFSQEERDNLEFIFSIYPNLQVAYIEKESNENNQESYYSCLIDGHCALNEQNQRIPIYRIQLPGNPILGDGKSDNQNTALIFYRGEYLQLIDANQDNYLEECLKIRSVLGEFEPLSSSSSSFSPYDLSQHSSGPVAIVGAREYIFSEKIGVLGDVAAGKEQTFGTLTQRVMATIGGKLHYGHPDFLNAVFMTTRGGVSKGQKGLHLNEDIYAGINAFQRGGRIKHVEYYQCAKGRDLGFASILNFVTKIGSGMGEQMLSREYYYLGTNLPLDRFLTFYYAHPGFHINNIFIMLAVQMFLLVLLFIGALRLPLTLCSQEKKNDTSCYDLMPVFDWIKRVVLSIFVVLMVSLLPLFLQELNERGFWRALTRLGKHMISMSPLFEIFVTQTYCYSILSNMTFGGAKYIGSGRGFAITRHSFATLYMRFADSSLYMGARHGLILLFASLIVWMPHLIYFWVTFIALVLSPFVFNPHQFSMIDFLIDYKQVLDWFFRGHGSDSKTTATWISFCRLSRMRMTGIKRQGTSSSIATPPRAKRMGVLFSEICLPLVYCSLCITAYLFAHDSFSADVDQHDNDKIRMIKGLSRIGLLAIAPLVMNAGLLLALFFLSLLVNPFVSFVGNKEKSKWGSTMAGIAHTWAVMNLVACFGMMYLLENWKVPSLLLALIAVCATQRFIVKLLTLCLSREFYNGQCNLAWWSGRWYGRKLGWHSFSQPLREYMCKIVECTHFGTDFILVHMILMVLFLFCLVPSMDRYHTWMMFWTMPNQQEHTNTVYTLRQQKYRRRIALWYGLLFILIILGILAIMVIPFVLGPHLALPSSFPFLAHFPTFIQ